eukprot:TRINITY_DN66980_c7_g6_i1.p1 TRINITY_DN66980_c7_g6~~TRINITY_DN66980_c7_g6_i1.p1  ORF type:complete len:583 (-),score=51.23 TRINITY_DN66980_c7_g6_i1:180-1928(-)
MAFLQKPVPTKILPRKEIEHQIERLYSRPIRKQKAKQRLIEAEIEAAVDRMLGANGAIKIELDSDEELPPPPRDFVLQGPQLIGDGKLSQAEQREQLHRMYDMALLKHQKVTQAAIKKQERVYTDELPALKKLTSVQQSDIIHRLTEQHAKRHEATLRASHRRIYGDPVSPKKLSAREMAEFRDNVDNSRLKHQRLMDKLDQRYAFHRQAPVPSYRMRPKSSASTATGKPSTPAGPLGTTPRSNVMHIPRPPLDSPHSSCPSTLSSTGGEILRVEMDSLGMGDDGYFSAMHNAHYAANPDTSEVLVDSPDSHEAALRPDSSGSSSNDNTASNRKTAITPVSRSSSPPPLPPPVAFSPSTNANNQNNVNVMVPKPPPGAPPSERSKLHTNAQPQTEHEITDPSSTNNQQLTPKRALSKGNIATEEDKSSDVSSRRSSHSRAKQAIVIEMDCDDAPSPVGLATLRRTGSASSSSTMNSTNSRHGAHRVRAKTKIKIAVDSDEEGEAVPVVNTAEGNDSNEPLGLQEKPPSRGTKRNRQRHKKLVVQYDDDYDNEDCGSPATSVGGTTTTTSPPVTPPLVGTRMS